MRNSNITCDMCGAYISEDDKILQIPKENRVKFKNLRPSAEDKKPYDICEKCATIITGIMKLKGKD